MREFLKPAPVFQTKEFEKRKEIVEKLMKMETYKRKQIIDVIRLQDKTSMSFNDSVAAIADDNKKHQWKYIQQYGKFGSNGIGISVKRMKMYLRED